MKSKRNKFLEMFLYPKVYSLYNTSIQVHLLPDSRRKKKLQRLLLKLAHPDNLWIRLLNGDKTVTREQVEAYVSVSGDPASSIGYYDTRIHKVLTDEQKAFNDVPKDMLVMLYNKLNNKI
jgi:hypothetical protein